MLNKLLTAISGILLVVIVGSVIYLMIGSSTDVNQTKKNDLPFHKTTSNTTKAYKEFYAKAERAIHPKTLLKLADFYKSPNGSFYILQESTAKVLGLEPKGACVEDRREGVVLEGSICFPFAMKLENKGFPEGYTWVYLTETNIKRTNVYIKDKGGQKVAQLKDIQPNDIITTIEKWDPSVPWDVVKLIEYLDKQMVELSIFINRV